MEVFYFPLSRDCFLTYILERSLLWERGTLWPVVYVDVVQQVWRYWSRWWYLHHHHHLQLTPCVPGVEKYWFTVLLPLLGYYICTCSCRNYLLLLWTSRSSRDLLWSPLLPWCWYSTEGSNPDLTAAYTAPHPYTSTGAAALIAFIVGIFYNYDNHTK